jgi:two-component system LytT family sensor kinase
VTGGWLLAAVVGLLWGAVYLVTQVFADPPLPTGATLLAGVALSSVLILGYPSVLRGPRQLRARGPRPPRYPRPALIDLGPTMPLRRGLTFEAADRTVRLLLPLLGGDAVAITDTDRVLAFAGPGRDHHRPGQAVVTDATARVLGGARTVTIRSREELGCPEPLCPLRSAVIAPLSIQGRTVGALKVYRVEPVPPPLRTVEGMAGILSLHLELAELDHERQLAADAKLNALRAQINPHFLFNTLNTIASKARTDPEEARQLLLRLSDFFRYSTRQDGHFADFGQEYFFVRTYVSLEQARYGDRLRVRYDVDPQVLGVQVPVLVIQPLVENAVKHGLAAKVQGGTVTLRARVDPLARMTAVTVRDDGVGMDTATLDRVLSGNAREASGTASPARPPLGPAPDGGVGLRNISERLRTLFGERYGLDVRSAPGQGTTVDLRLPLS